jgi:hypothetical protein
MFSVCRQDIIEYTTVTSMATGGIGVVITTGTGMIGIGIIPIIIGVVEISTGRHQVIMAMSIMAEKSIERQNPTMAESFTERRMLVMVEVFIERQRSGAKAMFTGKRMTDPTSDEVSNTG